MYPAGELTLLLAGKAGLRRRIAVRRLACVADAADVARPLARFDRAIARWRRLQSWLRLADALVGIWRTRSLGRRLISMFCAGPLIGKAVRAFVRQPE